MCLKIFWWSLNFRAKRSEIARGENYNVLSLESCNSIADRIRTARTQKSCKSRVLAESNSKAYYSNLSLLSWSSKMSSMLSILSINVQLQKRRRSRRISRQSDWQMMSLKVHVKPVAILITENRYTKRAVAAWAFV